MRIAILIAATLLASARFLAAEQCLRFPRQQPVFTMTFADTWIFDQADQPSLFARSVAPGDESVSVELLSLAAKRPDEAAKEAAKVLAGDFSQLKTGPPLNERVHGFTVTCFNATGENDDGGRETINCAIFQPVRGGGWFMLVMACPPNEAKRHANDLKTLLSTVKTKQLPADKPASRKPAP